jgi:hypothetical protein
MLPPHRPPTPGPLTCSNRALRTIGDTTHVLCDVWGDALAVDTVPSPQMPSWAPKLTQDQWQRSSAPHQVHILPLEVAHRSPGAPSSPVHVHPCHQCAPRRALIHWAAQLAIPHDYRQTSGCTNTLLCCIPRTTNVLGPATRQQKATGAMLEQVTPQIQCRSSHHCHAHGDGLGQAIALHNLNQVAELRTTTQGESKSTAGLCTDLIPECRCCGHLPKTPPLLRLKY